MPTAVHDVADRHESAVSPVTPVSTRVDHVVPSVVETTAEVVESTVASA